MPLIEDDADINPTIPPSCLEYIRCLSDTHKQYTRFFDALLIPRPSHAAFFRDLKGFRSLPTTIHGLTLCDPENASITKDQRKENYRDVSRKYLGSRFAHPWCRKAMAGTGNTKAGGWWGAEWAATGKSMSKEQQEQEDKLHRLLVPLWIGFRSKMFPGDTVVQEWWESRQLELSLQQPTPGPDSSKHDGEPMMDTQGPHKHKELKMAKSSSNIRQDSDLSDGEDEDEIPRPQADTAATGVLRLAAATMLFDSMPRMQKWKLKRELKKRNR